MYFSLNLYTYLIRQTFKNLFNKSWDISENKSFEIEVIYNSQMLFLIEANLMFGGRDHGGPELCIGLFGLELRMELPDARHWNSEANRWETDEEMKAWSDKYSKSKGN